MAAKVQKLSEMLAKRREELGSSNRFEWPVDDEKSFWVIDPRVAPDEWTDDMSDLVRKVQDNEIAPSDYLETYISMYLDDDDEGLEQSGDYIAMFDGFASPLRAARDLLEETVAAHNEQTDPTRPSSRSTRRSSKRR